MKHNHEIQTGEGQILKADAITQCECGAWIPAIPEPYYPSLQEKILHFFGFHQWTYSNNPVCVMCTKHRRTD